MGTAELSGKTDAMLVHLRGLTKLEWLTKLKRLGLGNTDVSDDGLAPLRSLKNMKCCGWKTFKSAMLDSRIFED